jgi:2-polyprenyl-3-methyl-5-hydroxy-6-metoxy-1,4-benzoquinol methylase
MTEVIRIVEREECLACESVNSIERFSLWDDRYAFPGRFQIKECINCGSYYLGNSVAKESLSALYKDYYPKLSIENISRKSNRTRLFILNMLNIAPLAVGYDFTGLNVLDVGFGSGASESIVKNSGGEWTGIDIDPKRVEFLRNYGLQVILGDVESICCERRDSYDVILAGQVIEHAISPKSFLIACHTILKQGGAMVLSTPNGNSRFMRKYAENWINWHVPYHTVIFSPLGLTSLAEACGYSVTSIKTVTPATWCVHQKKYKRPSPEQIGSWYNKSINVTQLVIGGVQCNFGDCFRGNGDMIEITLKKN